MWRITKTFGIATLCAAFALTACDENPTASELEESSVLGAELALDVAVDATLTAASVDGAETLVESFDSSAGRAHFASARAHFAQARAAYARRQFDEVLTRARTAREEIARGVIAAAGESAIDQLVQESAALLAALESDPSAVDDPQTLVPTLASLVGDAQNAARSGDAVRAGERAIHARQQHDRARDRTDRRQHDGPAFRVDRARLQVAMAAEAIALAGRLIGDAPTETQARLLEGSVELLRKAEAALAENQLARASFLGSQAEFAALRAVVDVDGVSDEEAQEVLAAAEAAFANAQTVVAAGGSAVDQRLLEIAGRLLEKGKEKLAEGAPRGVATLWHSAAISGVLVN